MNKNSHEVEESPVTLKTDDARQGVTGFGLRYVLIFSLVGVIAAFMIVFLTIR